MTSNDIKNTAESASGDASIPWSALTKNVEKLHYTMTGTYGKDSFSQHMLLGVERVNDRNRSASNV